MAFASRDYAQAVFPYSKEVKHIASTWHTDTEYVNQFLAPTMLLRRCKNRLPSNFCVDDSTIQEIIGQRRPLHEEIKEGKIYLADYSFLTPLTQVSGRGFYYCAPIAAFHVNDDGILVPLAVQLGQRPGEVWTPKDPEDEWQLAKAYVKCSDQQADLIHHSLLARIVEAVANATLRKMPSFHPVHTLLMPYFRPILAMNMSSREVLTLVEKITGINRRQYSKIGEHLYRDFHIDQQFVPNCFEAVGTHDPKKLPHYPYRQKALRAWDNMSAYVTDFILAHYTNNDDVMNDEEVQSWVREIYRDALPQYDAEGYRYSGKIRTVNQLCTLITWMVFEASFRLPALTTNIWERASVIANAPLVMKRTPPLMKGLVQTMTLMTSFPGRLEAPSILALCTLFQEFASKFRAFESEGTVNNNKDG
ncbi:arachidonate 12-lipoxygenase, 12R-type-like [Lineus longissimus]|uniref:arachidonate 12-lipoxygenase, 12R-type-like n=1 Tax=Lineus longissimus TaxID=88925 RepID=UPI00315CF085